MYRWITLAGVLLVTGSAVALLLVGNEPELEEVVVEVSTSAAPGLGAVTAEISTASAGLPAVTPEISTASAGLAAVIVEVFTPLGACCDGTTGVCTDNVESSNCVGGQLTWSNNTLCNAVLCQAPDCNMNGIPDASEPMTTRTFGVQCFSIPCSNGTQWSLLFDWLGNGPNFENLNCGPVPPGFPSTTAAGAAAELVRCINDTVCPSIAAVQQGFSALFDVTVPGVDNYDLCVGRGGLPPTDCCFTTTGACSFNPEVIEIIPSQTDCNDNGVDDAFDIFDGTSADADGNGVPDECEAIPTVSQWGLVVMTLLLLTAWKIYFGRRRSARTFV